MCWSRWTLIFSSAYTICLWWSGSGSETSWDVVFFTWLMIFLTSWVSWTIMSCFSYVATALSLQQAMETRSFKAFVFRWMLVFCSLIPLWVTGKTPSFQEYFFHWPIAFFVSSLSWLLIWFFTSILATFAWLWSKIPRVKSLKHHTDPIKPPTHDVYLSSPLNVSRSEIRILEIVSPTGRSDVETHDIVVQFHVVSLEDHPEYCALSYVWGDGTDNEPITVQFLPANDDRLVSTEIEITRNLASALRCLAEHINGIAEDTSRDVGSSDEMSKVVKTQQQFRVWADALSINQKDNAERGQQVMMMGRIYKNAETVFASISPDERFSSEEIERAFDGIQLISHEFSNITTIDELMTMNWLKKHEVLQSMDSQTKSANDEAMFKEDVDLVTNKMWDAINRFPHSTYFTRIWIIQEVCLAPKLVFIHQHQKIEWKKLANMYYQLHQLTSSLRDRVTNEGHDFKFPLEGHGSFLVLPKLLMRDAITLLLLWEFHQLQKNGLSLSDRWSLANLARSMEASNPKDYVYGLLGLTEFDIVPRYQESVSVESVYVEYVVAWLSDWETLTTQYHEESVELDFLRFSGLGIPKREEILTPMNCSWVPAFHICKINATIQPTPSCSQGVPSLQSAAPTSLSASKLELTASGIVVGECKTVLPVTVNETIKARRFIDVFSGYILGYTPPDDLPRRSPMLTLFYATTLLDTSEKEPNFLTQTLCWLQGTGLLSEFKYGTFGHKLGERVVCFGKIWREIGVPFYTEFVDWYAENFSSEPMHIEPLKQMLARKKPDDSQDDAEDSDEESGLDPKITDLKLHDMMYINERGTMAGFSRRVFTTTNNFLGMCPEVSQEGDILVVFKGSALPSMLRRVEGDDGDEDKWLHLGCCFVPELLKGEAAALGHVQRFTLV